MSKYDLSFDPPLMNAAGSLGFAPDPRGPVEPASLGAFVTNPVSLRARTPAHNRRFLSFPGGLLLHTGYPNPGLREVIRRYSEIWGRSGLQVLVHLLGESPADLAAMAARLESIEAVGGIEVGLPPGCDIPAALALVAATAGEKPVIARLPLERAVEIGRALAGLEGSPIAALSLGAPRGALPGPQGTIVHGRCYGPAVFPLALQAVLDLSQAGLPVIGAGGVFTTGQAEAMLAAGAVAVQLDTALWRGGLEEFKFES